ncbi:MAG: S-layer homology domain-containing protein [Oscillospiraceae bacterium]|jgi:hypothetical protein|nr:S-layer homology domain-containing protein [Oscillospiraceae bacterium]
MKNSIKKRIAGALALLLLTGSVALMAAGDSNDPLITRSYLEADYKAQLQSALQTKANNAFSGAYSRSAQLINFLTAVPSPRSFTDVLPSDWFYDAVNAAVMKKVTSGTGDNMFSPGQLITRGDFVTMLHRFAGSPSIKGKTPTTFSDVPLACYYDYAVKWASSEKIVSGISADKFDPGATVTREQIALILYKFQLYLGNSVTMKRSNEWNSFSDKADVSGWAETGVQWAVSEGVIRGADGKILPAKGATRAETVTLLHGFSKAFPTP